MLAKGNDDFVWKAWGAESLLGLLTRVGLSVQPGDFSIIRWLVVLATPD